jgi:hypothetical protein
VQSVLDKKDDGYDGCMTMTTALYNVPGFDISIRTLIIDGKLHGHGQLDPAICLLYSVCTM